MRLATKIESRQIGVGTFVATPAIRQAINEVLDSGRVSYGLFSRQFERNFARLHGCPFGVLSNSGTSSLQVALQALKEMHGWADGDEVIIPAVTFVATANIVLHNRMVPVAVDVDPWTYNIDPGKIEAAITPKTRAIIPVHLFGQSADMLTISSIAAAHGLKIIEDSCEAMFVTFDGRHVGSWGDVGCFSMYVAHILTAGVGGVATTCNPDLAAAMRSLVDHGRDGIIFEQNTGGDLEEITQRRFRFERIGHSFRITEFEAAIALAQLDDWQGMIKRRQGSAVRLSASLVDLQGWLQMPYAHSLADHSYMMYPIVVRGGSKWPLVHHLEAHGIETREMLPLVNQPCYAGIFDEDRYPVAKWINRGGFYVGCHHGLADEDMDYIAEVVHEFFG